MSTPALDAATAALGYPNVKAILRVIRAGESNQENDAYTLMNGGGHFDAPPWVHPWSGIPTTEGAKACGAFQFLGTTWAACDKALGLGGDFSPASQNAAAVYLIQGRGALAEVERGDVAGAIAKLAQEWVSLPGLGARAAQVFTQYGGTLSTVPPAVAGSPPALPTMPSAPPGAPIQGKPMPIAALIAAFGPLISSLIPQVSSIFNPTTDVAKRNTALAETVIGAITNAAGQPNLQAALEQMQADPEVKAKVVQAVVTHPDVLPALQITEIGGGVAAARTADAQQVQSDKPFWKASAVFWVSILLIPMVLWYVGSSIVGGVEIPADWPWYAQIPLKLFGKAWDDGARVGLANLVVGMILGGICGVYFGVSVTQAKQAATTQAAADKTG